MALPVTELKGVKVYNLSSGKTLPQWLKEAKSIRALRYNSEFRSRIELIQDLEFPSCSGRIKASSDGKYLIATGVYPPQVRVFQLDELSMKFERHFDAEIVQFLVLSDDFSKMVFLRDDRTIELHAKYGGHFKFRVPRIARDLAYQKSVCDLYAVGSASEAWRISLEQGRFLKGIDTGFNTINKVAINPNHELIAFGSDKNSSGNHMEFYDPRDRAIASQLCISEGSQSQKLDSSAVSGLSFANDGLTMAVGTTSGHVLLYDIRSKNPLMCRDHRYGLAINSVMFHESSRKLVSADSKILKFWDLNTTNLWTSVEPPAGVNDLCVIQDSGIIFAAAEQSRVHAFYIPALGAAPQWCSFLDSITEELEEEVGGSVYDDYKFVTKSDLAKWGLEHLIGSKLLRAYMHGYFMDIRLYKQLKAVAEPFDYESYVSKRVQQKMSEQKSERITLRRKAPKVNAKFAEDLLLKPKNKKKLREAFESGDQDVQENVMQNPLMDERFSKMFKDPAFEIDPESDEFKRLNASGASKKQRTIDDDLYDL